MRGWLIQLLEKLRRLSRVDVPSDGGKRILYCLNTGCVVEVEVGAADPTERFYPRHTSSDFWLPLG